MPKNLGRPTPAVLSRRAALRRLSVFGLGILLPYVPAPPRLLQARTLPSAIRVRPVYNVSEFASALATANPGDHIVLSPGVYAGNFTLDRAGTAQAPIVIRAAQPLTADLRGTIALNSAYGWLYHLRFLEGGGQINLRGTGCVLSRCMILGGTRGNGATNVFITGQDIEVSYCEFARLYAQGIGVSPAKGARRARLLRNYFHDNINNGQANCSLYVGASPADELIAAGCTIENNLFVNTPHRYGETLLIKSARNAVRFNTVLDCKASGIFNRAGDTNIYEGNWVEDNTGGGGSLVVFDKGCQLRGNKVIGKWSYLDIFAGNRAPDAQMGSQRASYPAAWGTLMVGNIGAVRVGRYYSSANPAMTVPASNTVIEAQQGSITYNRQQGTIVRTTATSSFPQAVRLNPNLVGPRAP